MRIGVIQASSQADKNALMYDAASEYASGHEVINFGVLSGTIEKYSYIETAVAAGLLLESGAVDFILTGCSSGQGMMLACNSMPGVLCGYAPTPKDAYLFAQINNGNAISLPLGEEYTWTGAENLRKTVKALFSEPFGQGYPKSEAARKIRDTALLKEIRHLSQTDAIIFLSSLDKALLRHVSGMQTVTEFILANGTDSAIVDWLRQNK